MHPPNDPASEGPPGPRKRGCPRSIGAQGAARTVPRHPPTHHPAGAVLAALLLLLAVPLAGGEDTDAVKRTLPAGALCGSPIDVTLHLDWGIDGSPSSLMIHEHPPEGWDVSQASNGGSLLAPGEVRWFLTDPAITEITYRLDVPLEAAGTFAFHGGHRDETTQGPDRETAGAASLEVACPQTRVQRESLAPTPCGAPLTVQLALDWGDTRHLILEEDPPAGWDPLGADHGGNLDTPGRVKWFLTDPQVTRVAYQVQVPEHENGTHTFSGVYRDDRLGPQVPPRTIGGHHQALTDCGETPPGDPPELPRAHRIAPPRAHPQALPAANNTFTVTVDLHWADATTLHLEERLPAPGILVIDASHNAQVADDRIRWQLHDPTIDQVHYELQIVDTAVIAVFGKRTYNGTIMDDVREAIQVPPAPVEGTPGFQITHRMDGAQDCRFDDDDLFRVIDAWKHELASDNELFSGIDAWKHLPSTYCQ